MTKQNKIVIFAGGETAGPVMPLLALAKYWQKQDSQIEPLFVDRKRSVAAHIVPKAGFKFRTITSGKMRRYWSIRNFFTPFFVLAGFFQSIYLLLKYKPIVVVGAGGYIQVPLIVAAWILRIPRVIHQLDIVPTFSNRIVSPLANKITTTFERSLKDFPQGSGFEKNYDTDTKIFWTGSPSDLDEKESLSAKTKKEAVEVFQLDPKWPTILVIGGSTGAVGLNKAIVENLPDLLNLGQIIHSTGAGKAVETPHNLPKIHDRYHQYEYIDRRDLAYSIADIVIARAGIATITDLATLGKVSIIVPMPNSHQEVNAQYLYENKAALVVDQTEITDDYLGKLVRKIFFDAKQQKAIQTNIMKLIPKNAAEKMLKVILSAINE